MVSAVTVKRPCGAIRRVHQFPKPSRYAAVETAGVDFISSGRARSDARLSCTFRVTIMGVGWGKSYLSS